MAFRIPVVQSRCSPCSKYLDASALRHHRVRRTLRARRLRSLALATPRKSGGRSAGLDACLPRHAHACTRVTAARARGPENGRQGWGGGGGGWHGAGDGAEGGSSDRARAKRRRRRGAGDEEEQEEASKGGPLRREATVRTRRGIASHTGPSAGTGPRQRPQLLGPERPGARAPRPGPCSRQRQRQARASHATRTRPSRSSREHKPRFFHPRRYLPSFI